MRAYASEEKLTPPHIARFASPRGPTMTAAMSEPLPASIQQDWNFVATRPSARVTLFRIRDRLLRRGPAPAHRVLVSPHEAGEWTLYFIYAPDGALAPAHAFTLDRLRAIGRKLLVVCATPDVGSIPAELPARADALVWKAPPGFDFSAYRIGLDVLATCAPGSDVLVLNDSSFGPLSDPRPALARARWDLTGFTATPNVENHVQSYAFYLRDVTRARVAALAPVLMPAHAYDAFWPVVLNQETRFARVADRTMSVGSLYYVDTASAPDPTLQLALPLLRAGFPFLKRSLLGKLAHLHPREEIEAALRDTGYPL